MYGVTVVWLFVQLQNIFIDKSENAPVLFANVRDGHAYAFYQQIINDPHFKYNGKFILNTDVYG